MTNVFHKHLDVCAQCREHPFQLCTVGARLLRAVATPESWPDGSLRRVHTEPPESPLSIGRCECGAADLEPCVRLRWHGWRVRLNARESIQFAKALLDPAEPNEALRKAAERFREKAKIEPGSDSMGDSA